MPSKTFQIKVDSEAVGKDTTFDIALTHNGILVTNLYLTTRQQGNQVLITVTDRQGNELLVDEQEV